MHYASLVAEAQGLKDLPERILYFWQWNSVGGPVELGLPEELALGYLLDHRPSDVVFQVPVQMLVL